MGRIVILAGGISSRMKQQDNITLELDEKLLMDSVEKSKTMIRLGKDYKPFLDYLLMNIKNASYDEVVIVVNEKDRSIIEYYDNAKHQTDFSDLKITFAYQPIPEGRNKPLGTADALYHALKSKPEWASKKFTMCNSDNLYSVNALKLMKDSFYLNSMIDYEREGLGFDKSRIEKFAVTRKDSENFLTDIIEKPTAEEIDEIISADGFVGVSMNIFQFDYDLIFPLLEITPTNPKRGEKEIPTTVKMLIEKYPKSIYAFRLKEVVPDLTSKSDILQVQDYLKNYFHGNE